MWGQGEITDRYSVDVQWSDGVILMSRFQYINQVVNEGISH